MERVKADAASLRIENRIGQQVVDIDQIGSGYDQPGTQPLFRPDDRGNGEGDQPMSAIMQDGLEEA